jgi:hypothetical protein
MRIHVLDMLGPKQNNALPPGNANPTPIWSYGYLI